MPIHTFLESTPACFSEPNPAVKHSDTSYQADNNLKTTKNRIQHSRKNPPKSPSAVPWCGLQRATRTSVPRNKIRREYVLLCNLKRIETGAALTSMQPDPLCQIRLLYPAAPRFSLAQPRLRVNLSLSHSHSRTLLRSWLAGWLPLELIRRRPDATAERNRCGATLRTRSMMELYPTPALPLSMPGVGFGVTVIVIVPVSCWMLRAHEQIPGQTWA